MFYLKAHATMLVNSAIALAALLVIGVLIAEMSTAASCGISPIKPIPPIGCRDLRLICNCDSAGQNCTYSWRCVK